ncbi:MAG: OprO/OprP family phosphate-selective porin [Acidobacteria bacterium]|jgi:phosphate-selective porin|nr:OprO/OprP family phosphate-selective porin [Acidobacteriota bacterium]
MKRASVFFFLLFPLIFTSLFGVETSTSTQAQYPNLMFNGFARVRYTWDFLPGKVDGFSIANARFGIRGDISKYFSYTFNIEGTSGDPENKKMVYDVYIESNIIKNFKIRLGQFKYAFGMEQTTAEADVDFINKAEVVSNLIKPTRDIGLQVSRDIKFSSVGTNLTLAIINGSGSNIEDENNRKTFVGRFLLSPVKRMTLGVSYYDGTTGIADKKIRTGAELKLEINRVFVKAEYIAGKDKIIKKDGYYVTFGYTVLPSTIFLVRYDYWDINTGLVGNDLSRWTFGLNYFFGKNVLWRTNYERRIEKPAVKNDVFSTQLQVKF